MLAETSTECEEKQLSFEEKQVLRKEELEIHAITTAVNVTTLSTFFSINAIALITSAAIVLAVIWFSQQ
eukprot:3672827-Amphidinium_carterae.1